ncbi:putative NADH-ubiquinone oxidoreductase [Teratosphaeria destructans]|uniref:NADH-ubiquinone oxidoreductase n=1 Tax=Teratosphaeria destructans TaxID=418781 RepID=A0A9W7SKS9_9PEZI|nr:putative NADH-ubiquinone oxidoreductase [Teratosphaeria destructans]
MADHTPDLSSIEEVYQPKDAVAGAIKATAVTGTAGLFVATIQNTLTRQNYGAFGTFSRFGGTLGVFAAVGGSYEFAKCASANLREKDDAINPAIGGFLAGNMLGLKFRSAPACLGYGAGLAAILFTFSYTGGKLSGYKRDPNVDEVARKEYMRKNRRRPVEEIVNELGEGRGIYGPGYEERRAQRIKEAYGIDVPRSGSISASPS